MKNSKINLKSFDKSFKFDFNSRLVTIIGKWKSHCSGLPEWSKCSVKNETVKKRSYMERVEVRNTWNWFEKLSKMSKSIEFALKNKLFYKIEA